MSRHGPRDCVTQPELPRDLRAQLAVQRQRLDDRRPSPTLELRQDVRGPRAPGYHLRPAPSLYSWSGCRRGHSHVVQQAREEHVLHHRRVEPEFTGKVNTCIRDALGVSRPPPFRQVERSAQRRRHRALAQARQAGNSRIVIK